MEEDRIEYPAGGGGEAERDVRYSQHRRDARELLLDAPDGIDGGDGVPPQVVVARAEGKRERVEQQVLRLQAIAIGGQIVDPVGDLQLPFEIPCLATLIDEKADDRCPMLPGESEHAIQASPFGITLLEIG